jgi:hypothetical protein
MKATYRQTEEKGIIKDILEVVYSNIGNKKGTRIGLPNLVPFLSISIDYFPDTDVLLKVTS